MADYVCQKRVFEGVALTFLLCLNICLFKSECVIYNKEKALTYQPHFHCRSNYGFLCDKKNWSKA